MNWKFWLKKCLNAILKLGLNTNKLVWYKLVSSHEPVNLGLLMDWSVPHVHEWKDRGKELELASTGPPAPPPRTSLFSTSTPDKSLASSRVYTYKRLKNIIYVNLKYCCVQMRPLNRSTVKHLNFFKNIRKEMNKRKAHYERCHHFLNSS